MITDSLQINEPPVCLDYHFNERELRVLARFLRKNQEKIPDELLDFSTSVEKVMYNSMTIDEAEAFFS